jgi:hypothetical protein
MEGLRPSFSAHVSWREHGAPVWFCLVRWVLLVLSSGSPADSLAHRFFKPQGTTLVGP